MQVKTTTKIDKQTALWPAMTKINYLRETKPRQSMLKIVKERLGREALGIISQIERTKLIKATIWICMAPIINSMWIRHRASTIIWNRTRQLHQLQMARRTRALWTLRCKLGWTSTWIVEWISTRRTSRCSRELVKVLTQSMWRSRNRTGEWFENKTFLKQLSITWWINPT